MAATNNDGHTMDSDGHKRWLRHYMRVSIRKYQYVDRHLRKVVENGFWIIIIIINANIKVTLNRNVAGALYKSYQTK